MVRQVSGSICDGTPGEREVRRAVAADGVGERVERKLARLQLEGLPEWEQSTRAVSGEAARV